MDVFIKSHFFNYGVDGLGNTVIQIARTKEIMRELNAIEEEKAQAN